MLTKLDEIESDKYDGVVSGDDVIQGFDDSFFKEKAGRIDVTGKEQRYLYNGAVHLVFASYIIKDREGQEIGQILQGIDLTTIVESYREDIIRLSVITFFVLVVASLILYLALSRLLGELVGLNEKLQQKNKELISAGQQLEGQVLKRTTELGEAKIEQPFRHVGKRLGRVVVRDVSSALTGVRIEHEIRAAQRLRIAPHRFAVPGHA